MGEVPHAMIVLLRFVATFIEESMNVTVPLNELQPSCPVIVLLPTKFKVTELITVFVSVARFCNTHRVSDRVCEVAVTC
jgi:hypothetical protein